MSEHIKALQERIPQAMLRQRKQGGTTLSYISWYDACNLLDERAPGWSMEIKQVGEMTGKVFVVVALTIDGVTRENIGCEDEELKGYGDVFSNSVGMALRRAAALFGLGRHLYDKDDKPTPLSYARQSNPPTRSSAPQPDEVKPSMGQLIASIKTLRLNLKITSDIDFSKMDYDACEKRLLDLRAKAQEAR